MRRWRWGLLVVAAATVLTMSCSHRSADREVASVPGNSRSGSPAPGGAAGGPDRFNQCMKDNGAEPQLIPAPMDGNGTGETTQTAPPAADQRRQQEALEKCRQYVTDGGNTRAMSPQELEQARSVAKCMRAAGVQYPDPNPNDAGGPGALRVPEGVDLKDPAVRAKLDKCSRDAGMTGAGPGAGTP